MWRFKINFKHKIFFYLFLFFILGDILLAGFIFVNLFSFYKHINEQSYKTYFAQSSEDVKLKLVRYLALGNSTARNIATFYSPTASMYLSDNYLSLTAKDLLNQNFFIYSVDYVIKGDLEIIETPLEYLDSKSNLYSARWYKDLSGQINLSPLDPTSDKVEKWYIKAKHDKKVILGKPYRINMKNYSTLVQPIIFPIYSGDNFYGIMVLSVSLQFIDEALQQIEHENDVSYFVVNQDATILSNTVNPLFAGEKINVLSVYNSDAIVEVFKQKKAFSKRVGNDFIIVEPISFDDVDVTWFIGVIMPYESFIRPLKIKLFKFIGVLIVVSLLVFLLLYSFIRNISATYTDVVDELNTIYRGELTGSVKIKGTLKEEQRLIEAVKKLKGRLLKLVEFIRDIGDEKYEHKLFKQSDNDELAEAFNYTVDKLEEKLRIRKEVEESKRISDWINQGLTKIYQASRGEDNSFELLGDAIVDVMVSYTDAAIGGLFIFDNDKNKLRALSTFAYSEKKAFDKEIELGDGLVGTVALERKTQYFEKIPKDYQVVVLGLAEIVPQSMIIQPLIYEDELLGVIELIYLRKLKDYEREFIDKASLTIAQAIRNIKINVETYNLLLQSQKQAEALESVQTQLEKHIKELEERERLLKKSQAEMKGLLDAVNHTVMTIEYTTEGILLTANEKYLRAMDYTLEELQGVNVLELVKTEREELEKVIRRVSRGEYYEKVMKRFTKHGEVRWLYSTYTPYYDIDGNITKILYFAFDVTDMYTKIQNMETEVEKLRKQIKLLRAALDEENE